jgi:hypothetical protein
MSLFGLRITNLCFVFRAYALWAPARPLAQARLWQPTPLAAAEVAGARSQEGLAVADLASAAGSTAGERQAGEAT